MVNDRRQSRTVTAAISVTTLLLAPAARSEPAAPQVSAATASLRARTLLRPARFELGTFGGLFFPSAQHELLSKGPFQRYRSPAAELGARVGFFPWRVVGVEVEGAAMPAKTQAGDAAGFWVGRAHLVGRWPLRHMTLFALAGFGALGAGSNQLGVDADPAAHFGLGARLLLDEYFSLRFDARDTLSQKYAASAGAQTHHPELLLGLTFSIRPAKEAPVVEVPPLPDRDGDGAADEYDGCPDEVGVPPNGCPPRDTDRDGLSDSYDFCPDDYGKSPHGCPPVDSDGDRFVDELDRCPSEAGPLEGCPDPDPDRDGILNGVDRCPTQAENFNYFQDSDGCPDTLPEQLEQRLGLVPGVEFERESDRLRRRGTRTLEPLVAVLLEFPALRFTISARPAEGGRPPSAALLERQAAAVKTWLVTRGIDATRLETRVLARLDPSALPPSWALPLDPRIELRLAPTTTEEPNTAEP